MADFGGSTRALTNLLIGLARGLRKRRNMMLRRGKKRGVTESEVDRGLAKDFREHMQGLVEEGYFNGPVIDTISQNIWYAIAHDFKEQK